MTADGLLPARGIPRRVRWPLTRIGDHVELHYGKALTAANRRPGDTPVYGSNGQCGWHDTPLAAGPTVVLGRKGQGPLGVEWCSSPFWVIDTAYFVTTRTVDISLEYFYYLTKYVGLNHLKDGVSNPSLGRDTFYRQAFPLPPFRDQESIVALLSGYDDLIENNTKRIKILEEMARSLYREWFVELRFPGHPSAEFAPTMIGKAPKGWDVGRLDDILVLQRGFDLPIGSRRTGTVPVFAATGQVGSHDEAKVRGPGVLTGRSGSLGTVNLVLGDFWPLNTALWVKEFRWGGPFFAYYLLSSLELRGLDGGAAVPTLNRNDVHALKVLRALAASSEIKSHPV